MTASETGREIPADVRKLAEKTANGLVYSGRGTNFDATCKAVAEAIMADRAARLASLEAERAKTLEAYRAGVEETCREWAPPEDWSDAELTQQGLDARRRAAWVRKEMMKEWRVERALALASEKGQADG